MTEPLKDRVAKVRRRRLRAASRTNVNEWERLASVLVGGGLVVAGLTRRTTGGLVAALAGGALLNRGLTGYCHLYGAMDIDTSEPRTTGGQLVEKQIVVRRPPVVLYRAWRRLEDLPTIMTNLVSVRPTSDWQSHWVAKGPIGSTIEWDAEIINEREGELIAWKSLPDAQVDTAGSVQFSPIEDGQATMLQVQIMYNPPAGKAGATIAWMLGQGLEQELEEDLQRFKERMEAREAARVQ